MQGDGAGADPGHPLESNISKRETVWPGFIWDGLKDVAGAEWVAWSGVVVFRRVAAVSPHWVSAPNSVRQLLCSSPSCGESTDRANGPAGASPPRA